MLKDKVNHFLRMLDSDFAQSELVQTVIVQKMTEKEALIFGYLSSFEETALAQEIALEIALTHFLKIQLFGKETIRYDIEQDTCIEYLSDSFSYPNPHSISDEDWQKWVSFFIEVFDFPISEFFMRSSCTFRLLNGLIVQCYTPSFFEHINLHSEEIGEPTVAVRYVFHFYLKRTPSSAHYADKYGLSKASAQLFKESVQHRFNLIIASPNESYIEDFSQLCFNFIPLEERVVSIEKKEKIRNESPYAIKLAVSEGESVSNYIKGSLRMNANRIFIDSLDSGSAFEFSQVCCTGHDGSIAALKIDSVDTIKDTLTVELITRYTIPLNHTYATLDNSYDVILFIDDKEGQPALSFYRYQFNKESECLETLPLLSTNEPMILTENFSTDMLFKSDQYYQSISQNPVQQKKRNLQHIEINNFFETYQHYHSFEKIHQLKPLLKPTILLSRSIKEEKEIPIGASKFGGQPDLPSDIMYPYDANVPYSFIMQINCAEFASVDTEGVFPCKGMLYFFHKFEDEEIPLPYDYEGHEGFKQYMNAATIFHYDGDVSKLQRTERPRSIHLEKVKSAQIELVSSYTLPHLYEEQDAYLTLGFTKEEIRKFINPFYHALSSAHYTPLNELFMEDLESDYEQTPLHQLLGYALPAQGNPIEELVDEFSDRFKQPTTQKEEWLLFCQLEVDYDINLLWAADGFMYYYIKKEDFIKQNFKNIYSIMQCS